MESFPLFQAKAHGFFLLGVISLTTKPSSATSNMFLTVGWETHVPAPLRAVVKLLGRKKPAFPLNYRKALLSQQSDLHSLYASFGE